MKNEEIILGRHTQRSNIETAPDDRPDENDKESEKYPGITE